MKATPLKSIAIRAEQLPDTPKPVPWRAFKRFESDAVELAELVAELRGIGCDPQGSSGDVDELGAGISALVGKVRAGFDRFEHEDNYQSDGENGRVLKNSHIAKRLAVLAASFPTGNPGSADGFMTMLTEHVSAAEGLCEIALESACRTIVETHRFLPCVAEALKVLAQEIDAWSERRLAVEIAQRVHESAVTSLIEAKAKREAQEHNNKVKAASFQVHNAMQWTQRLAKDVEDARVKFSALVEQHAQAEQRETKLMRELRKLTMTPEEVAAAEIEAAMAATTGQRVLM